MENEIGQNSNNEKIKNIIIIILSLLLVLSITAIVYLYLNKTTNMTGSDTETNAEVDQTNETEEVNTNGEESIDFTLCEESECDYEISVCDEVHSLKYTKNLLGEYNQNVDSILYLDGIDLIELNPIESMVVYEEFKDLLVFGVHKGGGPNGYHLMVYNSAGRLINDIYELDEETGMYVSPYWDMYLEESEDENIYYEFKEDSIILYAWIKPDDEDISYYTNPSNFDSDDVFAAKYEITYQDLLDGKDPTMVEVLSTIGDIVEN